MQFKRTQWTRDLLKHFNNNIPAASHCIDIYTSFAICRIDSLDIVVRADGKFFDKTSKAPISANLARLLLADFLQHLHDDVPDLAGVPRPEKSDRLKIADVILDRYKEFSLAQIEQYKRGESIDTEIGIVEVINDR